LIEPEGLSLSSISCLQIEVSVGEKIEVSSSSHSRNNVEISFNIQAEAFVEFTLSWISLPLISIDDIPLVRKMVLSLSSIEILVLLIDILVYVHDLSSLVGKVLALHSEHLPPS
jgi:L-cystine uptake protein TcyP (sodium:dicarboxylate symporter family)